MDVRNYFWRRVRITERLSMAYPFLVDLEMEVLLSGAGAVDRVFNRNFSPSDILVPEG